MLVLSSCLLCIVSAHRTDQHGHKGNLNTVSVSKSDGAASHAAVRWNPAPAGNIARMNAGL
jgi:hypothetical protein